MKPHRRWFGYVALMLGFYAVFGGVVAVNAWFLDQAREYRDLGRVIDEQERTDGLYNSLTHALGDYKLAVYERRQPAITSIGSSRSLQYRDYFFKDGFYNMGGLVQSVDHALGMGRRIFAERPPEVIIVSLDFWFFCSKFDEGAQIAGTVGNFFAKSTPVNRIMQPLYLLNDGVLSPDDYWRVLTGQALSDSNGQRKLGITAVLRDNGFGLDGSHFNFERARDFGARPVSERWSGYVGVIEKGKSGFGHDCRLSERAVELLGVFIDEMGRSGARVVLIAPPIIPSLIDAMAGMGDTYGYIDEAWEILDERFGDFYNFHDPRGIGSSECEFLDEIHGGEVTHMRTLREIARSPDSALYGLVDVELLDALIAENTGRMIVAHNGLGLAFSDHLRRQSEGECAGKGAVAASGGT